MEENNKLTSKEILPESERVRIKQLNGISHEKEVRYRLLSTIEAAEREVEELKKDRDTLLNRLIIHNENISSEQLTQMIINSSGIKKG